MRHPPTYATCLASRNSSPCAHRSGLCHKRYVIKDGKHADCWHVGGINHGCFLRFDLGGTPRITHVKTAVLQASAFMRIGGSGIDGGLLGAPLAGAKLHREYLTKGPGSIKGDGTYVGCASRYDDTDSPSAAVALGYTDSSSYSCKVEALKGAWRATPTPPHLYPSTPSPPHAPSQPPDAARGLATGGLAAGFFNVSLEVFANHRGFAYHEAQRQVDIAGGLLFDAELVPRITAVSPRLGSLAGGTDVTITGAGFGSDSAALDVLVGGVPCAVSSMHLDGVVSTLTCRVAYRPPGADGVAPMAAGRGARWSSGGTQMLLADLSTRAWASGLDGGGGATVEAWFEAPHTGAVSFLLPKDATGTLSIAADPWATPTTLATVTAATTTLSPWPTWPADAAGGAVAAKVSVTAGRRYWLKLSCPTPTDTSHLQNGGPGPGCAVGARFHTAEAPYPLRLASRKMASRVKGSSCTGITDRDACCAALDSSDRPCVPAVVRFTSVVGTPVCLDAATAASEDHRDQIAACPLRSDALGAARARVTLDNQVACSSLTDRHACCGAIDGGTTAFRAGYACVPSSTIFQNGYRCETPLVFLTRTHCALLATHY